ncbi:MAG: molybdopterin-dependent oxidoreductase [Mariprofundaceae bacterium]
MSNPYYIPEDKVPLPPKNADVLTTACDYCIVACGYKIYRWPTSSADGGPKASQNALGIDFPCSPLESWPAPNQYNQVMHNNKLHNIMILPDRDTKFVNKGDSSIRGGCIAQKVYNPRTPTHDRLKTPLIRIAGTLLPVSWDMALDIAAEVGRYAIEKYGELAYGVKSYSYQFFENTYAIRKFYFAHVTTPNFSDHDNPGHLPSTPGFRDAGFDNFGPSYDDWRDAEALLICGTDPWETKTIIYTQFIREGIDNGQKCIIMNPRRSTGVAYAEENGGLWLDVFPGTDSLVMGAIMRIILENGWEDNAWMKKWLNNNWETSSGFGQGTRNTNWQWRTTWGKFQPKSYDEWKKWLMDQKEYQLSTASKMSGVAKAKIKKAAEMLAKPKADGSRVKASFGIEKGGYWSANTVNTNAISALAIICGAGGRPGQVVGRFGGHQRGGQSGGRFPTNMSPQKVPGRRRLKLNVDIWTRSGHTRFAHVIGTTWTTAMTGTQSMQSRFEELITRNPNQVTSFNKAEIIATLKKRMDSGGMVVVNQDIYLRDPIGARFADIIFPAATWGEEDFLRANGERRLRLYSKFYDAPGEAKPDWWIIAQLAKRMGYAKDGDFDWKNSNDVAEESSRFSRKGRKAYHMVKVAAKAEGKTLHQKMRELGTDGIQGPTFYVKGKLFGTKRLHDTELPDRIGKSKDPSDIASHVGSMNDLVQGANVLGKKTKGFNSQTGKQNIQKFRWSLFSDHWEWLRPKGDELWMSNGRTNEIWQSKFDDFRRPYIMQRWPENWCEIHPDDARRRGIESGDRVVLFSDRVPVVKDTILGVKGNDYQFSGLMKNGHIELTKGAITAIAVVTPDIKKGCVFTDFNDHRSQANALTSGVPDSISGNWLFKMAICKVAKVGESSYKRDMWSFSFTRRGIVGPKTT